MTESVRFRSKEFYKKVLEILGEETNLTAFDLAKNKVDGELTGVKEAFERVHERRGQT